MVALYRRGPSEAVNRPAKAKSAEPKENCQIVIDGLGWSAYMAVIAATDWMVRSWGYKKPGAMGLLGRGVYRGAGFVGFLKLVL
jgi:hypothetical protein